MKDYTSTWTAVPKALRFPCLDDTLPGVPLNVK